MVWSTVRNILRPIRRFFLGMPRPRKVVPLGSRQLTPALTAEWLKLESFSMFVDKDDQQIARGIREYGLYEYHVEERLKRLLEPGMTYLDIGANIGYHTLVGAHRVGPNGRVFAVEMCPVNARLIRESLAANQFNHVVLHETAVGAAEGEIQICATPGTSNRTVFSDTLHNIVGDDSTHFVPQGKVKMTTIDKLVPPGTKIDVLKIDVEGFEAIVLRGAKRVLTESRPTILMEFFPNLLRDVGGTTPTEVLDLLRGHGYALHHLDCRSKQSAALSDDELIHRAEKATLIDVLAIAESLPQVQRVAA